MRYSLLLFLAAATLAAQDELPDFGVKAGMPASSTSGESTFRRTAGFSGEVHVFWRFSFEGDALLRKYSLSGTKMTDWDFPMLLEYRFQARRFRPFLEGGYSLSYESREAFGGGGEHVTVYRYDTGPVGGVGSEFKRARLRFEPELRLITPMVGLRFQAPRAWNRHQNEKRTLSSVRSGTAGLKKRGQPGIGSSRAEHQVLHGG